MNFTNLAGNFCTGFNETCTFIWKPKAVATTFNENSIFFKCKNLALEIQDIPLMLPDLSLTGHQLT